MTDLRPADPAAPTRLVPPASAWLLALASLAGQVVTMLDRGTVTIDEALVSSVLGAVVVAWFSHGVLRARRVRTWIVGILLTLIAVFSLVGVADEPRAYDVTGAALAVAALGGFAGYVRSDCFAALRAEPARRAALAGLVAVAAVVGLLGGATAPVDPPAPGFHVHVGL